ncbi:MAG: SUMF1/EgtB/PvdO family nonheme iron enzyme [Opitutales bacterium]
MALFKNNKRFRLPHETSPLRHTLFVVLIVVLALLVLGGFWLLSQMGPKKVDYNKLSTHEEVPQDLLALKKQGIELEAQFEEILAIRVAEPQDIALIKKARDLQKQYLDSIHVVDSEAAKRYRNLDARYQDLAAGHLRDQSLELEAEAESLATAEDYEAACLKYREAVALQEQINERFPLSSSYNVGRSARIERQTLYLTAEPLLQRSLEYQSEAEAFVREKDWQSAEEKLQQAIALQDQLNREYRGTNQASVARLESMRIQLVGIRSGQDYLEVERVAALADARLAEGETLEAASLYQEAARLQRQLNETFVGSPYASAERVAEFQRKSETAQSFELGRAIERDHDTLRQLLSQRQTFDATEIIVKLRRNIREMREAYPRSSLNDEELELKIRYLNLVQSDLGYIQDRVYNALLPIPDEDKWQILRTEVSQALYSLIMGTNPSRNQGELNPVDSVSWVEAKNFCERLSWIMGQQVRLPTENEFRSVLGRLRYVVLEEYVWSASDSGGVAQPVGKKAPFSSGCYDLLGNVSEWLESVDRFEAEDARHIGGHAQDRIDAIFSVPIREVPRGDRSRMTGFRIVMRTS